MKVFNINVGDNRLMCICSKDNFWFKVKDLASILGFRNVTSTTKRLLSEEELRVYTSRDFPNIHLPNRGFLFANTAGVKKLINAYGKIDFGEVFDKKIIPFLKLKEEKENYKQPEPVPEKKETQNKKELSVEEVINFLLEKPEVFIDILKEYKELKAAKKNSQSQNEKAVERYYTFRDAAKMIGIRPKLLSNILIEKKYVYRNYSHSLRPYSKYVPEFFQLKEYSHPEKDFTWQQTVITPKGFEMIKNLVENELE